MAEILASNFNNSSNPLKITTLKKTNRAHIQPLNWHPGFAGNYLTTASLIPACRKDGRKGEIKGERAPPASLGVGWGCRLWAGFMLHVSK